VFKQKEGKGCGRYWVVCLDFLIVQKIFDKNYLLKRIMEIEEQRHDEAIKMLHSLKF
jgi:hypothetical protein